MIKNNSDKNSLIKLDLHNKPRIFTEKSKNVKPRNLNHSIENPEGEIRHFSPANKEWHSSVYSYNNNNYNKNIPAIDKTLNNLILNYFNLYFRNESLKRKRKSRRMHVMQIRRGTNRIFVSKGELKHTNDKIAITLYLYNEEKRLLMNKLSKFFKVMYSHKSILRDKSVLRILPLLASLFSTKENLLKNVMFKHSYVTIPLVKSLLNDTAKKTEILIDNYKGIIEFFSLVSTRFKNNRIFYDILNKVLGEDLRNKILKRLMVIKKSLDHLSPWTFDNEHAWRVLFAKEFKFLDKYWSSLYLNNMKLEEQFIFKLSSLVSKIYRNKKIEFNIVKLKHLYLNSDIFTQLIALKLRKRKNKVLKVLRRSLYMVKLPRVNRVLEKYGTGKGKNVYFNKANIYNNMSIDNNKDVLNQLLFDNFIYEKVNKSYFEKVTEIKDVVFNSLKYKSMAGVRLEAKGRLTRRSTASRSLFKIKWKGSLRNIDSSYKGLSSVVLRGHLRSNLQYSVINSKTSNGAFGIKGWISGK